MSEFAFDITNDRNLEEAFGVATSWLHEFAAYYYVHPSKGLVFLWGIPSSGSHPAGVCKFPFRMKGEQMSEFALSWLRELPKEAFGKVPDCDECKRGWRLRGARGYLPEEGEGYSGDGLQFYVTAFVTPTWVEYHK